MFNLKMLDLVIGVVFYFVFASLICSATRELVESLLNTRAKLLEKGLKELLDEKPPTGGGVLAKLYDHPLIDSLYRGIYSAGVDEAKGLWGKVSNPFRRMFANRNLPGYIPAENFAAALLDVVAERAPTNQAAPGAAGEKPLPDVAAFKQAKLEKIAAAVAAPDGDKAINESLKTIIRWAYANSNGNLDNVQKALEGWYDRAMDRVSGWYKRWTQLWLFVIGLLAAMTLNLDTLQVTQRLYFDDAYRTAIAADATKASDAGRQVPQGVENGATASNAGASEGPALTVLQEDMNTLGSPIGWSAASWSKFQDNLKAAKWSPLLGSLTGWLITAVAMTMGAPFWFDLLNRLVSLRTSLKPEDKADQRGNKTADKKAS